MSDILDFRLIQRFKRDAEQARELLKSFGFGDPNHVPDPPRIEEPVKINWNYLDDAELLVDTPLKDHEEYFSCFILRIEEGEVELESRARAYDWEPYYDSLSYLKTVGDLRAFYRAMGCKL